MKRLLFLIIMTLLVASSSVASATVTETYGDFSLMFSRSAGQYWSGNQVGGQWAWSPQSSQESWIGWGNPATWPPAYHERFLLSGDWVYVDGWWDNNTYYKIQTSSEWTANDTNCLNRTYLSTGAQHYVKWTVPSSSYCVHAEGIITEMSTGHITTYRHDQKWSRQDVCANPYNASRPCLIQTESWWDDNNSPFQLKLTRSGSIGKGVGMAWNIRQTFPSVWNSDLRYWWGW